MLDTAEGIWGLCPGSPVRLFLVSVVLFLFLRFLSRCACAFFRKYVFIVSPLAYNIDGVVETRREQGWVKRMVAENVDPGNGSSGLPELQPNFNDVNFAVEEDDGESSSVKRPSIDGAMLIRPTGVPRQREPDISPARVTYSIPSSSPMHPMHRSGGDGSRQTLPPKAQNFIKLLEDTCRDPNSARDHVLSLTRKGPLTFGGETVDCGPLDELPATTFEHVRQFILEKWGGGDYALVLRDGVGRTKETLDLSFSVRLYPPKIRWLNPMTRAYEMRPAGRDNVNPDGTPRGFSPPIGANSVFSPAYPGQTSFHPSSVVSPLEHGITELRRKQSEIEAMDGLEEAQAQLLAKRRERQRRQDAMDKVQTDGDRRDIQELKDVIRDQQQQMQAMMMQMMQGFKDSLLPFFNRPADNGIAAMVPLLVEAMKSGAENNRTILEGVLKRETPIITPPPNDMNSKFLEIMLEQSKNSAHKAEKLVELVLTKQINEGDSKIKYLLDGMKMGQDNMEKMQELVTKASGSGESDGPEWNAEAGVWSNIGGVIFALLKKFLSGSSSGAPARPALDTIAELSGRPQGTTQFTDADLNRATGRILQQAGGARPVPQLNAPVQSRGIEVQAAPPRGAGDLGVFEPMPVVLPPSVTAVYDETEVSYFGEPEPVFSPPATSFVATPPSATSFVAAPPLQASAVLSPEAKARLVEIVTEMVSTAVGDLEDGRADPDWVEYGLSKLPDYFKAALARTAAPIDQVAMLASYCEQGVFENLKLLITDQNRPDRNTAFFQQLEALVTAIIQTPAFGGG